MNDMKGTIYNKAKRDTISHHSRDIKRQAKEVEKRERGKNGNNINEHKEKKELYAFEVDESKS